MWVLCSPEDKDTSTIAGKIRIKLLSKSDWESIDCQVSDSYKILSLGSFSSFSLPLLYLRPILPPASSGSLTFLNIQFSSSSSQLIKYNTDFLTWHSKPSMYEPRLEQCVPLQDPMLQPHPQASVVFPFQCLCLRCCFPEILTYPLHTFPRAAIINYYLDDLKQQRLILSQSWNPQVQNQVIANVATFRRLGGRICSPPLS